MPAHKPSPIRRALFWVGLLLMGVGVVLTVIFFYLIALGAPIYLVGLVLVWVSGQPVWARLLVTVLPFVAWIAIAEGSLALAPRQPAVTFLVPEGYEGHITLVMGEPCGLPPEKVDGRLIYRVPANGIIITQNPAWDANAPENEYPNKGYYTVPDNKYYVVDRAGQRLRELTEVQDSYSDDPDARPASTTSWRSLGRDDVGIFPASTYIAEPGDTTGRYTSQDLTVSSFARLNSTANNDQRFAQQMLADTLVLQCRQRGGSPRP